MKYALGLFMALSVSPALAQSVTFDATRYQMACRVTVAPRYRGNSYAADAGSGVYYDRQEQDGRQLAYVLTAAHLFRDYPDGDVFCFFPASAEQKQGTLVSIDQAGDWAVVMMLSPPSVTYGTLADSVPETGSAVTLVGFGGVPRKGFRAAATRVRNYTSDGDLFAGLPSSQGDSGGPVFDESGRICGIISATSDTETVVCCQFLRRLVCGPSGCAPTRPTPQPMPQQIPLPQPIPQPQPVQPAPSVSITVNQFIEALKADKELIASLRGQQGPVGPAGPAGATGPHGPAGTVDRAELELAIDEILAGKGITVRTIDGDRNVIDSEFIPLGGTLNLQHKPIR